MNGDQNKETKLSKQRANKELKRNQMRKHEIKSDLVGGI